jgi:meiotic recombination protein SPO11
MLTRQFVHQLSNAHLTDENPIPIFALVDYDPDGIAILSTYKNGSKALANENATLRVPRIQWLGPKSSDLCSVGLDGIGLLDLTDRDRRLARKMLENGNIDEECKRELRVMLMLGYKAEIQQLSERVGGLEGWLAENISRLKT